MAMKLMSWNVDGRTDKTKLRGQLSRIENENIDILALQEVKPKTVVDFTEKLVEIGLEHVKAAPVIQRKDSVLIACRWSLEPVDVIEAPWRESVLSMIIHSPYGEIEIHAIHAPNGSKNRRQKIDTFNGIYKALSEKSKRHRILCGDFNSPQEEYSNGHVLTFDKKNEEFDGIEGRDCERRVICGLANYDLADTYRELHRYGKAQHSHFNKNKDTRGRFDHVFSSRSLNLQKCDYLHSLRKGNNNKCLHRYEKGDLSDHSPIYAIYEPEAS